MIKSNQVITDADGLLFNSSEYINNLIPPTIVHYRYVKESGNDQISLIFQIEDNLALSLPRCPYAGLEIHINANANQIENFLSDVLEDLKGQGVSRVIIKHWPGFINELKSKDIIRALEMARFEIMDSEYNQHIVLDDKISDRIHRMELRKIEKCNKAKLLVREKSVTDLRRYHDFITFCRNQQGLNVNIDFEILNNLMNALPNIYSIFSVEDPDGKVMACTITVAVNGTVVYNYLPAFDRQYSSYSPLALLYYEIFRIFQKKQFRYMDLGISSINGDPQSGLLKFKERMGAELSMRNSYQLIF